MFSLGTDNQDFIEIYIGSSDRATASYYGRFTHSDALQGRYVYSNNNQMVVVLRTDGRQQNDGRGFSVTNVLCKIKLMLLALISDLCRIGIRKRCSTFSWWGPT